MPPTKNQLSTNPDLRLYYVQRPPPAVPDVTGIQSYFPSLELLFPSIQQQSTGHPALAATELILDISADGTATIENMVTKEISSTPVWIRKIHLIDPVGVMSGEYIVPKDGGLPAFREAWQITLRKINDPYNEAYTAAVASCMTSRLVERGLSPHFCRFYGTCNGRAASYRFNITEDLVDIEHEAWFHEGIKSGAFQIMAVDPDNENVEEPLESWEPIDRPRIVADGDEFDIHDDGDEEEDGSDNGSDNDSDNESMASANEDAIPMDGEVILSRPRPSIRLQRSSSQTDGSDSNDSDMSMLDYIAILKDFPVQLTFLERCDGTMDRLMVDETSDDATPDMRDTKEERWTAWVFQVIAALTVSQQAYDLIHNDLHTNNIVWTGTAETHLYYHVHGAAGGDRYYRVPTYGRIFKIIDFGRATFRVPQEGKNGPVWLPDVYAPGADADGQYNFGHYFDQARQKISPNKSFDLCRLAIAMLETLWPTQPAVKEPARALTKEAGRTQNETVSALWNLMWMWLTDKDGKNFLRTPSGRERYPQFDLYCAIAAGSENAVPAQQLTMPLFDEAFRVRQKDIPTDVTIWKLQAHPPQKRK